MNNISSVVPIIKVSDIKASIDYYCNKLGFTEVNTYFPDDKKAIGYASLIDKNIEIHLSNFPGDGVSGSVLYFYVNDIDQLYSRFVESSVNITVKLVLQTWGNKEFYVSDLDGNILRFGEKASS